MNFRRIAKAIVAGVGGALAGGGFGFLGFLVWLFFILPKEPSSGWGGIFVGEAIFKLLVLLVCLGAGLGGLIGAAWSLKSRS